MGRRMGSCAAAARSILVAAFGLALTAVGVAQAQLPVRTPLDGGTIDKYVEAVPHFANHRVSASYLQVDVQEFQEKVLPAGFYAGLSAPYADGTYVWGYTIADGKQVLGPHYPGFTVEAKKSWPTTVLYQNSLPLSPVVPYFVPTDQTLHWANPLNLPMDSALRMLPYLGSPPVVAHLHGAEVPSEFDGGPDAWFTPDGIKGAGYRSALPRLSNSALYIYPNSQEPTTLWFHDHVLGATRLNVYRGLAAFYLLRDWYDARRNRDGLERPDLPGGPADTTVGEPDRAIFADDVYKPEVELAIQDRIFDTNGQLYFPHEGDNPDVHPLWLPEFFGDVMVVNGKSWPYLNVEPRRYRFRVLDGCNARFLRMWLANDDASTYGPTIWQIGSDGGLLDQPVGLDPSAGGTLFLAPGERADVVIDFHGFEGQTLTLHNDAATPFPTGDPVDPDTTGQIMQFRVGNGLSNPKGSTGDPSYDPAQGASPRMSPIHAIDATSAVVLRQMTLNEVQLNDAPEEVLVNNTKWSGTRPNAMGMLEPIPGFVESAAGDYLSELPKVGTTEVWEIINTTMDAHPIHLHLVQFQLLARQDYDPAYLDAYYAAFPGGYDFIQGVMVPPGQYIPAFGPPLDYSTPSTDGAVGGNPPVSSYLVGSPTGPLPGEAGWKDTVKMHPGQVTWIAVRFTQQDGAPYRFDATGTRRIAFGPNNRLAVGPGYVWHCHIIDHEDNEMMRPYKPVQ